MAGESEARPWRGAVKGLAALALWPAIAGCLPSLGYLVGQNWLLPAWLLGGGVAAWAAWHLGRWRALLLCALYAIGSFFLTSLTFLGQSSDYLSYHLPQVFLLEAGWNPALQGSLEAVEALGIAPLDTFRPFHTLCFPLFGAQWCAGTDLATGALHGFNWLVALLFPGAGYLTLRTLRRCLPDLLPWQVWALTVLFVLLDYRVTATYFPIDGLIYLLLLAWCLTLIAFLSGRAQPLEKGLLCALPFLLAGVKQSAAVPIALGFALLLLQALIHRDWTCLRERSLLCLLTLCAIALCWFHPYLTNWAHYGSPLFPAHSFLPAFQGWDITVDLRDQAYEIGQAPSACFLSTNWTWIAQAAVLGLIAIWQRPLRPLFAVAALLLLNALLMPWWLYTYPRYTPASPLIGGFLLCALPALGPRLPMRRLLQTTLLLSVLLAFLSDYQDRGPHAKTFLQALCIASNLQRPLYFPELAPTQAERPVLVSKNIYHYNEDRPSPNYPKRFPERDGSYALAELFETRGKSPLNRNYALFRLARLRDYEAPADFLFLFPKSSAYARLLHPWDQPLSLAELRTITLSLLRNFRRRWLEAQRDNE